MLCEPRVLLDATAVPADRGGVGRYVDSLAAALDAAGSRIAIACRRRDGSHYGELAPHATVVPLHESIESRPARLGWEQMGLPKLARRLAADVVHSPHYTMPLAYRGAAVVTLHDATFFTAPELHSPLKARFFRSWTRTALRHATSCVVPSAATADELTTARDGAARRGEPARMATIPHGVDVGRFHPPEAAEMAAVRESLGIGPEGYVAFLGTLEPRKNVPTLIRGFVEAVAASDDPPALVLAGQRGWDPEVEHALDAVPPRLRVIRAGYLPYESLAAFLGGAELIAYPSLGEGFGLPVLEAMACGSCVLTTDRLALPEVGGDAVAYCDVHVASVATALAELLADPDRRSRLGRSARIRAQTFDWAASAAGHREIYERALRDYRTRRGTFPAN